MAVTMTYQGRPTTWGATIIQSSTLSPVVADWSTASWDQAQTHVRRSKLKHRWFPIGEKSDPSWSFMLRTDLTGVNTVLKTLVGIHVQQFEVMESAINLTEMDKRAFTSRAYEITSHRWAYSLRTLTNLSTVSKIQHESASMTIECSPEDPATLILPTEMWENLEECISFIQKRNAAGVPTYEPALRALAGLNPLG